MAMEMSEKELFDQLQIWSDAYHNGESLVSDLEFDNAVAVYEQKYGKYNVLGAETRGEKVKLPAEMLGFSVKATDESILSKWLTKHQGPYSIEDKLDGITLVYESLDGQYRLYTRGNGKEGSDVTKILPFLNLPKIQENAIVRGELVMKRSFFNEIKGEYSNARNVVSGLVNGAVKPDILRMLTFYTYEIYDSKGKLPQSVTEKLKRLQEWGFEVLDVTTLKQVNWDDLSTHYIVRNESVDYDMDGIVIGSADGESIAMKIVGETAEVIVKALEWNVSKGGRLIPKVVYEPVFLSGGMLEKATGNNASYVIDRNIGPGSVVVVTRSGSTIPKVLSVVKETEATWPSKEEFGEYRWNSSQVDLIIDSENDQMKAKKLQHFLTLLDIKNVGEKRVLAMVKAGILSITDLIRADKDKFMKVEGVAAKLAMQYSYDIKTALNGISVPTLLDATYFFPGIGKKRFTQIFTEIPDLLELDYSESNDVLERLKTVKGINKLAEIVVNGMPLFIDWYLENDDIVVLSESLEDNKDGAGCLDGKSIVMTGVKHNDIIEFIGMNGGRLQNDVNGKTSFLIISTLESKYMNGKYKKAQQLGLAIYTAKQFRDEYMY